jgi:hypothetical protein
MNAPTPDGVPVMIAVNAGIVVPVHIHIKLGVYQRGKDHICPEIRHLALLPVDLERQARCGQGLGKHLPANQRRAHGREVVERLGVVELTAPLARQLEQPAR